MWIVILTRSDDTTDVFGPFPTGRAAQEYGRAYRPVAGSWEARLVEAPRPY